METLATPISEETKQKLKEEPKRKKYSFLEILIVLSAIGVVVTLAFLAINPGKKGAEARNLQRQADVSYILSQISSYSKTKTGIPEGIPVTEECVIFGNEICKIGPYECGDFVDLSMLDNPNSDESVKIPSDPMYISINGTGYYIHHDGRGAITVCAPYAERNKEISFTKYLY